MTPVFTDKELIDSLIRPRAEETSKGDFGTLCMLCGSRYMTGAALLSATAALRSGVGLLKFIGSDAMIKRMQKFIAEPVFVPIGKADLSACSAFLCGCGIAREYDGYIEPLLSECEKPCVLDADCINFISGHINVLKETHCPVTVTPHPGEMARLTGKTVAQIQNDRVNTAVSFTEEYGCITVLKGHGTVIACPDGRVFVNTTGSSALAKGGSGDVLAGVIASLCAQGYGPADAAVVGVYLHGLAGDMLAERYGKSGVIPSDLPPVIGKLLG
ncbi:MAG: NAD(P)H-hydrate dehydratase [Clostridia bacterium]|nr:NAD(P)H-hydrate dehydratase [Clostridia bacterium]